MAEKKSIEATLQSKLHRGFFSHWYREYGRRFPWRDKSASQFGILVAEMMLRKTRAENVAKIWPSFIQEYDSPEKCSAASESDLLEIAGVLGLFGRVIDIKRMSEALVCCYEGQVPGSVEKLLTLPSVGIYTANAVVCFAFGQRVPLVDANVIRVFTRLTGESSSKDNRRAQHVWKFAEDILPYHDVVSHNYGILDFAAETCKSKKPNHDSCPLRRLCRFYSVTSGVVTPSRSRYNDLKTGVRR